MRTKTGEVTVWAESARPLSKCLVPPPEKRAGLSDVETRYRQRYLEEFGKRETDKRFLDAWSNLGESVEAVDGLYKPSTRSRSSEGTGFDPEKGWGDDGD